MLRTVIAPLVLALTLATAMAAVPGPAHAGGASDRLQQFIDGILPVLMDQAYDNPSPAAFAEQRTQLRDSINDLFDWLIISQLTVSRAWNDFTPEQQLEFADAFRYLLEATYMDRIQQSGTQSLVILSESELSPGKYEVSTLAKLTDPDRELPITYRLYYSDTWMVYDVVVEGVSLVGNYRSQFQELLDAHTPQEFIDIVRQKADDLKAERNE